MPASVSLCGGFPSAEMFVPSGPIKATAAGHGLRSCFRGPRPTLACFEADWFVNLCMAARDVADVHSILRMLHEGIGCTSSILVQVGATRFMNMLELRVDTADQLGTDIASRRVADDAIMVAAEQHAAGFSWSEVEQIIDMNGRRRETLEIYAAYGLHQGYTVPLCAPNEPRGFASYGFSDPDQMSPDVIALLSMVTPALYETSRRVRGLWVERRQLAELTPRQVDCLAGVARGLNDAQVAYELGISVQTVSDHIEAARSRYRARRRADLIVAAIRAGDLHWTRITGSRWHERH